MTKILNTQKNNRDYISVKEAARLTKYTKDYVGQLCREGKVEAQKNKRTWFVSKESLLLHVQSEKNKKIFSSSLVQKSNRDEFAVGSISDNYKSNVMPHYISFAHRNRIGFPVLHKDAQTVIVDVELPIGQNGKYVPPAVRDLFRIRFHQLGLLITTVVVCALFTTHVFGFDGWSRIFATINNVGRHTVERVDGNVNRAQASITHNAFDSFARSFYTTVNQTWCRFFCTETKDEAVLIVIEDEDKEPRVGPTRIVSERIAYVEPVAVAPQTTERIVERVIEPIRSTPVYSFGVGGVGREEFELRLAALWNEVDEIPRTVGEGGGQSTIIYQDVAPEEFGIGGDKLTLSGLLYVTNDAFFDTNTLVVDSTNNRVGIGTTSPYATFSVAGDTSITGTLDAGAINISGDQGVGGNLSITGTTTLGQALVPSLDNTIDIGSGADWLRFRTGYFGTSIGIGGTATSTGTGITADGAYAIAASTTLALLTAGIERVTIDQSGNVGIGTTTPSATFAVTGDGYVTGGFGIGTVTTTPGLLHTTGGIYTEGNITALGDLTVTGTTTLGISILDTLAINAVVGSDIVPDQNAVRDLGSASFFWNNAYIDTIVANNISAASTSIAGTQAETFTINSDNSSTDTEDATIIFYRGTVVPNALITWDATRDRFDFNQPLFIQNDAASTTIPTLRLQANGSQVADIFNVLSNTGGTLFNVATGGNIGIGTTSPYAKLSVAGQTVAEYFTATSTTATSTFAGGLNVGSGGLVYDQNTGYVGVGTTTPSFQFSVAGNSYFKGDVEISGNTSITNDGALTVGDKIVAPGEIGIGTTSPYAKLSIQNTDPDQTAFVIRAATSQVAPLVDIFSETDSNLFRINASGNVGIGTTTPWGKLSVTNTGTGPSFIVEDSASPDSSPFIIDASGNVGVGTPSPGARLHSMATTEQLRLGYDDSKYFSATVGSNNLTTFKFGGPGGGLVLEGESDSMITTLLTLQGLTGASKLFSTPNFYITSTGIPTVGALGYFSAPDASLIGDPDQIISGGGTGLGIKSSGSIYIATGGSARTVLIDTTGNITTPAESFVGPSSMAGVYFKSGNVGIGTTSPLARLSVKGAGTSTGVNFQTTNSSDSPLFTILDNGKVGVGTTSPQEKLSISGSGSNGIVITSTTVGGVNSYISLEEGIPYGGRILNDGTANKFKIQTQTNGIFRDVAAFGYTSKGDFIDLVGNTANDVRYTLSEQSAVSFGGQMALNTTDNTLDLQVRTNYSTTTVISMPYTGNVGNVGIGTTSPLARLSVKGAGTSTGVNFQTTNSSDSPLFTILDNGNVGVGTTSPGVKLDIFSLNSQDGIDINAVTYPSIRLKESGAFAGSIAISGNAGGFMTGTLADSLNILTERNAAIHFGTNKVLRMTIDNTGEVGIGTTSPYAKLSVTNTGSNPSFLVEDSASPDSTPFIIDANGNVGVGTTSPGAKFHITGIVSPTTPLFEVTKNDGTRSFRISHGEGFGDEGDIIIDQQKLWFTNAESPAALPYITTSKYDGGSEDRTIRIKSKNGLELVDNFGTLLLKSASLSIVPSGFGYSIPGGTQIQLTNSDPNLLLQGRNQVDINSVGSNLTDTQVAVAIQTQNIDRMVFTKAGLVGIGTTSPYAKLSVAGQTVAEYFTATSTTATSTFAGGLVAGNGSLNVLQNGNVGIGTVGPKTKLEVFDGDILLNSTSNTDTRSVGSFKDAGALLLQSGTTGGKQTKIYLGGNDNSSSGIQFLTQNTERMRIDNSTGNVGIGTTSPESKLHISGANAGLRIERTNGGQGVFGQIDSFSPSASTRIASIEEAAYNSAIAFYTDGDYVRNNNNITEKVRITSQGNIGIGTTSPYAKLSVVGETVAEYFTATSTTATSTFAGKVQIGSQYDLTSNITSGVSLSGTSTSLIIGEPDVALGTASDAFTLSRGFFSGNHYGHYVALQHGVESVTSAGTVHSLAWQFYSDSATGLKTQSKMLEMFSDGRINLGGALTEPVFRSNDDQSQSPSLVARFTRDQLGGTSYGGDLSIFMGKYATDGANARTAAYFALNDTDTDDEADFADTKMTLLGSGNLGLGTTSPWGKLSITNTGTGPSFIVEDSASPDSSPFIIDASGNVGIGTTTPVSQLDVLNTTAWNSSQPLVKFENAETTIGQGNVLRLKNNAYSSYLLKAENNTNTDVFTVNSSGQVTIQNDVLYSISDALLKVDNNESAAIHSNGLQVRGGLGSNSSYIIDAVNSLGNASVFRVTGAGNVGIGTTSPYAKLSIEAATNSTPGLVVKTTDNGSANNIFEMRLSGGQLLNSFHYSGVVINELGFNNDFRIESGSIDTMFFVDGDTDQVKLGAAGGAVAIFDEGNDEIVFNEFQQGRDFRVETNNADHMVFVDGSADAVGIGGYSDLTGTTGKLLVNGNVGIGTTSPAYKLDVYRSGDGVVASFTDSNGVCTIDPTSTALLCSSDLTLKKDIQSLDQFAVLDKVAALNAVSYHWRTEDSTYPDRIGFIAQEVEDIFPEFVSTGSNGKKAVAYSSFTPVLASAIQAIHTDMMATSTMFEGTERLTLIGRILAYFESVGLKIKDGIVAINNLMTDTIVVGSSEKPTGITLYDEVTGDPYCLSIRNGNAVSTPGVCGEAENHDDDSDIGSHGDDDQAEYGNGTEEQVGIIEDDTAHGNNELDGETGLNEADQDGTDGTEMVEDTTDESTGDTSAIEGDTDSTDAGVTAEGDTEEGNSAPVSGATNEGTDSGNTGSDSGIDASATDNTDVQ